MRNEKSFVCVFKAENLTINYLIIFCYDLIVIKINIKIYSFRYNYFIINIYYLVISWITPYCDSVVSLSFYGLIQQVMAIKSDYYIHACTLRLDEISCEVESFTFHQTVERWMQRPSLE